MQNENIVGAANALEGLATAIDSTWTDQSFQLQNGSWNTVPLSRADLSSRVRLLANRLQELNPDLIDEHLARKIKSLPDQVSWFQANTLPQLEGNIPQVVSNLESILLNLEQEIGPLLLPDWEKVAKSDVIPRDFARRIRSLESALKNLAPRAEELEEKIQRIDEAHAAALDLPTDLQALKEARDEVSNHMASAIALAAQAESGRDQVRDHLEAVRGHDEESKKLLANIESAYSAATTVGLAASFSERAKSLTESTWYWVALLIVALVVGGVVGAHRLADLQKMASLESVNANWVWLNASMSLLAIAAPVWFAWIATRQIGQRFRLAEDYAFKASVARAYEGYRREAARLDPVLEARLFASALDRLEEAPLRFLSVEEHGSPYEALLASTGFHKALEKIPGLRETAQEVLDRVKLPSSRLAPGAPPRSALRATDAEE